MMDDEIIDAEMQCPRCKTGTIYYRSPPGPFWEICSSCLRRLDGKDPLQWLLAFGMVPPIVKQK